MSWDDEFGQMTKGYPLTYFSEDTCNLITRSAWDKDALYLNYLNRAIPGGHQYCDRSHFSLYGLGRFWSIYHYGRQVHEQYLPPEPLRAPRGRPGPVRGRGQVRGHGGPPAGHL